MSNKAFFISTAIPYVNSAPHAGHALEFVQADIIARYQRFQESDVFFLSGTDDNALKNVLKAEESGEDVRTYIARHTELFKDLLKKLNISNDDFIRTSVDERHIRGAQKLWRSFEPDDVVKKKYKGLYCVGCEEFKTEKELVQGRCPEHSNIELQEVEEENYFFKLGNYSKQLEQLILSDTVRITPQSRKNEVLAFIRGGLEDLSISRSVARARGWGIPVPNDPAQVQYVWVDALSNYITALGYADDSDAFKKYWSEKSTRMHVIGKGITRFHAIYWPAFLLSAGVSLPSDLVVHGYITSGGQKMSKSVGNVIDPIAIINEYGVDALRYFLARHIHPFEDSDFTMERFKDAYNADLANGIGNQVARIMRLAVDNVDPVEISEDYKTFQPLFKERLDAYDYNAACAVILEHVAKGDEYIQSSRPFSLVQSSNETEREEGKKIIKKLVMHINLVATHLEPIMPETAKKILNAVKTHTIPTALFPRKE